MKTNLKDATISATTSLFDNYLFQIIIIVAIAVIISLFSRPVVKFLVNNIMLKKASRRKVNKRVNRRELEKRSATIVSAFSAGFLIMLWVGVIAICIQRSGTDLRPLLTGAGLFGVIFSFGAQNTIRDILAGIFIVTENQYRVGDVIAMYSGSQKISGTVEDITLRITRLRDIDGNLHIVRNGSSDAMTNLTFSYANVNINLNINYASDIDLVEKTINRIGDEIAANEKWAESILEPIHFLRIDGFEDSAIRIKALGQVEAAEQWAVAGEFRRRIKIAFEEAGIAFSYNHLVIHQGNAEKTKKTSPPKNNLN